MDDDRRTREAFDAVAADYARLLPDLAVEAPLDRAVLAAFVEMVPRHGLVADLGCGTGRVTRHLADRGLRTIGLDLSEGMVREARHASPDLPLAVAHTGRLPLRDGALAGLLAWYSLINLPTDLLPAVLVELARVSRDGAPLLVGFQSGDGERVERPTSYGHPVAITYHRHRVEDVADAIEQAGFAMHAAVRREASQPHETTPQAFLMAHRTSLREAGRTRPH